MIYKSDTRYFYQYITHLIQVKFTCFSNEVKDKESELLS